MEAPKEERSTMVILVGIVLVCAVMLLALVKNILDTVGPALNEVLSKTTYLFKVSSTDYNFDVDADVSGDSMSNNDALQDASKAKADNTPKQDKPPAKSDENKDGEKSNQSTGLVASSSSDLNYNFVIPEIRKVEYDKKYFPDAILDDAKLLALANPSKAINVSDISISIPKARISSPAYQGYNSEELLNKGFWISPTSHTLGKGEVVMLCHRRHFGPYDPRSCWYLDSVKKGDDVFVRVDGVELKYKVVGTNIFSAEDPLIYSISPNEDLIKIVTCHPLYSNAQRFVVLAKRVK
ncbi:sortase [Candidatus Dojkabacteria bacterium]|uniref:Sortase n=1 Tax=Candidatus Dojkabacteria bacterium TaxID=2099670 RepID=A0A3M0Z1S2_9BACT|nr:MAG: sortase [Candidatus Dojkabacteria bacterium]